MSPTVFRYKKYRFLFYSREEKRMHVHVWCPDGEAKIWLEPEVELAVQQGLKENEVNDLLNVTEERIDEIRQSWQDHFRR